MFSRKLRTIGTLVTILVTASSLPLVAQSGTEELAKAAQNPVGDLISFPFQNNTDFGFGPKGNTGTRNILNIQPVYPVSLGDKWNLITRTILPVVYQPDIGTGSEFGLGDLNATAFFSPKEPGRMIWGAGPVLIAPSATDDKLGTEKWSAGPSFVALKMNGPWVVGALVNQVWSFAGDDDRADVNQMLLQYFVNYNFPSGWYLTSAPINTANWEASSGDRWTIPLGGGIGKVYKIGKRPVNSSVAAFWNVEKPSFGPDWQLRIQFQLLFPK